jgi:hypothetical protein
MELEKILNEVMGIRFEDELCSIKFRVMRTAIVNNDYIYCYKICSGYPSRENPCPHGIYTAMKDSRQ